MTDWTTARVVRDRDGDLWGRGERDWWQMLGTDTEIDDEGLAGYDPTPVLDADGLPVVRTVGDLTARHLGCEVAIDGMRPALLLAMRKPLPEEQLVAMLVSVYGDITGTDYFPLDTPCELLPEGGA